MKNLTSKLTILVALIALTFSSCKKDNAPNLMDYTTLTATIVGYDFNQSANTLTVNSWLGTNSLTDGKLKSLTVSRLDAAGKKVAIGTYDNVAVTPQGHATNLFEFKQAISVPDLGSGVGSTKITTVYFSYTLKDGTVFEKSFATSEAGVTLK